MKLLIAMLAGLLFGVGLIFSGMNNPSKVLGFFGLGRKLGPVACPRDGWSSVGRLTCISLCKQATTVHFR